MYAVGKIVGVFGLDGYVKIHPYTSSPERLNKLRRVFLGISAGKTSVYDIDEVIFKNRQWMVKFHTINDRTAAGKIVGMLLFIEESEIEAPPAGSYFSHEVIGCEVWSDEGRFVGTIEDIYSLSTYDLWAIRTAKAVNMIPAVKEFVKQVDVRKKKVIVRLIEGLIEE
jgi:16S rRNA processing protein RimM